MDEIYNFSAGPATLPRDVLQQVQSELLDWRDGMSVMEVSHRGMPFDEVVTESQERLRQLLAIPDEYEVLFLQGGASLQFSMVPLNLMADSPCADYVVTGAWSKKAFSEAKKLSSANLAASSEENNFTSVPKLCDWQHSAAAAYCHITPNETIHGVEFHELPECTAPIVADMSSTLLSRPLDVSRYGLIYAGAQKNIGPSGITLVIAHQELLQRKKAAVPSLLDYQLQAEQQSLYNTPPTFNWYVVNLVLAWLQKQGGLSAMAEANHEKQRQLYEFIDNSEFYHNPVNPNYRSWMNVPFTLSNPALDKEFLNFADSNGLKNLKGHRSVGGMRASIYNAMPVAGVQALINVMQKFELEHQ